jgi:hypothetical protein
MDASTLVFRKSNETFVCATRVSRPCAFELHPARTREPRSSLTFDFNRVSAAERWFGKKQMTSAVRSVAGVSLKTVQ